MSQPASTELRRFFVFRHGETDWNREQRFQGHMDVPLNDVGRQQARGLIEPLQKAGVQFLLSSDLLRAYDTARIVADALDLPLVQTPFLREAHLGEAQGKTRAEIEAHFGAELVERWKSAHVSDLDVSYPGGETGTQVKQRVFSHLEEVARREVYTRIGVASHGGVIRRMLQHLLPVDAIAPSIHNAALFEFTWDPASGVWTIAR